MGSDSGKDAKRVSKAPIIIGFGLAAVITYLGTAVAFGGSDQLPLKATAAGTAAAESATSSSTSSSSSVDPSLPDFSAAQSVLESRVCGSPAVDGYAHVKPECLETSPTNKWWQENKPKKEDLIIHVEKGADYDGLAVGWGIGNIKATVEECAQACLDHVPKGAPQDGPFGNLPCNAYAWCSNKPGCFEPDAHKHTFGDCWLKFTEGPASPEVNMRGRLNKAMQQRHPEAPKEVQWHSGVILPRGVVLTNGSWSPRHDW